MTPADLKALAAVMAEMRVQRLEFPQAGGSGDDTFFGVAKIELHPSAFTALGAPAPPADPPEPEPTRDELLYASSVPVTEFERTWKDPE